MTHRCLLGSIARVTTVTLTLISFISCTTLRPVENLSPEALRSDLHVGDHVVIAATNGQVYELDVLRLDRDYLLGTGDAHKQYKVAYAAIREMQISHVSAARTSALVVVSLVVVLGIAYACLFGCSVNIPPD